MNQKKSFNSIPVLTTEAGSCLTLANWRELGIETVSYFLDTLLMKPGLSILKSMGSLCSYGGWQETIVLNASSLTANREGIYSLRSRFDGSLVRIEFIELLSLIVSLAPTIVILPPGFLKQLNEPGESLPKTLKVFVPAEELSLAPSEAEYGSYWHYKGDQLFSDFLQQIKLYADRPIYLSAELDLSQRLLLTEEQNLFLESDKPARDAMNAKVYSEQQILAIDAPEMENQHELIDAHCSCPTCAEHFTRAYLHHLFMQTPLLAQRYLIQHNVYYYQNLTS